MSRMRLSVVAFVALAIVAATLAGCGRKGLIKVNGEKIMKDDFYARLERVPVQTSQGNQMAGRYIVQQMIAETLVQQMAKEQSVTPTEAQLTKKIEFFKKQAGGDIRRALGLRGMTLEDLKRQIAVQQSFINVVSKGVTVPDDKVRKAYNDALKVPNTTLIRPETVRISGIICGSKAKAGKAYQVLKGGTEFSTVAIQYTEDELGKNQGGVLGPVSRDMPRIPKPVRDTAFSLQIGQYSKPVLVEGKWIIIKADQKRPKKITPYEDVKDVIREQLAMQSGAKKNNFREEMQKFTKKADIVINAQMYKDIGDTIKKEAGKALDIANKKPGAEGPGAVPTPSPN